MIYFRALLLSAALLLMSFSASGITEKTINDTVKKDSAMISDSLRFVELVRLIHQLKLDEIQTEKAEKQEQPVSQDSLRRAKQKMIIDSLKATVSGAPVVIDGDTLFSIYTSIGEITPYKRAESIKNAVIALSKDRKLNLDSILLVTMEDYTGIMYGNKSIMQVTENDAIWLDTNPVSLAQAYRSEVIKEVKRLHDRNNMFYGFMRIGKFLLVLISIVGMFFLLNFSFRKLKRYIIHLSKTKFKPITIKNYNLLDTQKEAKFLIVIANLIRYLFIIFTLLIAFPIIFSIFPQTKSIGERLFTYILNPVKAIFQGIIEYIPNLFTILVIWFCIRYLIKGLNFFAKEIQLGRLKITNFYPDWAMPTFHIIRFLLYAFMVAMIYPYLPGAESGIFQGISVFVGVIVSLGSTAVIGNIMAGLVITYMRSFKVGDLVKINETIGYVIEKTPLVTRVRTLKNEVITIPNSFMMSSQTINYNDSADNYGLIIHTTVGVQYDVPWQKVHELLIKAAKMTDGVIADKEPFVLEQGFKDLYPNYQINAYIKDVTSYSRINSDLHANIQVVFNEAKVNLQTPFVVSQEKV